MGRSKATALTLKQRRFVEAYMGEAMGNAGKAYRLAGYACSSAQIAYTNGHLMLRLPKIQEAIEQRVTGDPLIAGRVEIMHRLSRIVRGEERAHVEQKPDGTVVKIDGARHADEVKAMELLDKMQGGNVVRHELTGNGGKPIKVKKVPPSRETIDAMMRDLLGVDPEERRPIRDDGPDKINKMRALLSGGMTSEEFAATESDDGRD